MVTQVYVDIHLRRLAQFGTIFTFKNREKHPWRSVLVKLLVEAFHIFKIAQMTPGRAKRAKSISTLT